jgi:hypothetical protein
MLPCSMFSRFDVRCAIAQKDGIEVDSVKRCGTYPNKIVIEKEFDIANDLGAIACDSGKVDQPINHSKRQRPGKYDPGLDIRRR